MKTTQSDRETLRRRVINESREGSIKLSPMVVVALIDDVDALEHECAELRAKVRELAEPTGSIH